MAYVIKFVVELILLFALSRFTNAFWSLQKSPGLFRRVFKESGTIQVALERIRTGQWHKSKLMEKDKVEHAFSTLPNSIACLLFLNSYFESAFKAWSMAKYALLIVDLALISGSYFISPYVMALNLVLFLAYGKFITISTDAISEVLGSLQIIVLIVQKWWEKYPAECERFCTKDCRHYSEMFSVVSQPNCYSAS